MTWLLAAWRILRGIWGVHYRIPEVAYWALYIMSLIVGFATLGFGIVFTGPALLGLVISVQGVARWRIARHRSRGAVVVPIFRCTDRGKALEIQDTIIKTLQDHLSPEAIAAVHRLPVVTGGADRDYAARLCKRLRAFLVLQGDIRKGPNGAWSVYASVCQPLKPSVTHVDMHTRDVTPARAKWRWIFRRLTGVDDLPNREYPLEFADELQAVVQGTGGQLALAFGDNGRAERLLKKAIAVAPTSESPQMDVLRVDRAMALLGDGKRNDALRLLRKRSTQKSASPELLRAIDSILRFPTAPSNPGDGKEAIAALRLAAKDHADPQRDMTLYNLAQALVFSPNEADREEAEQLIKELSESSGHYSEVWFIKRLRAMIYWRYFEKGWNRGQPDSKLAAEAGRWYSSAIRARPKFRFFFRRGRQLLFFTRFPTPPIMFANARDGHERAGHRFRARWYELRFQLKRKRFMKRGERMLEKGHWLGAEANFDWCGSVGRNDPIEIKARVLCAISMKQYGDDAGAEATWNEVFAFDPSPALLIRLVASEKVDLPEGVPGSEPNDEEGITKIIAKHGIQFVRPKKPWQLH